MVAKVGTMMSSASLSSFRAFKASKMGVKYGMFFRENPRFKLFKLFKPSKVDKKKGFKAIEGKLKPETG